jgi:V/A-type H+-transporting ATPase subunit D
MAREQIAPTKSNLIRTKERLNTALEGYDLLEQ